MQKLSRLSPSSANFDKMQSLAKWWNGIHAALKMLSGKLGAGSTPALATKNRGVVHQ